MKRNIGYILVLFVVAIIWFVAGKDNSQQSEYVTHESPQMVEMHARLEENSSMYTVYNSLDEEDKKIYVNICVAAEKFENEEFFIGEYDTEEEYDKKCEELWFLYRDIMYEHPEYFWVNLYDHETYYEVVDGKHNMYLKLLYVTNEETLDNKKAVFDKNFDEIVTKAKGKTDTFEKILFVYDSILDSAEYDKALSDSEDFDNLGVTAYGCLVEGKTICSGYALAFNSIMRELGFECGVEFSNYENESSKNDEEEHVWNYCRIDGEYYYFDLTWDELEDDDKSLTDHSHMYFGITKDELGKSNQKLSESADTPECTGTKYNYFIYNGFNFSEYNFEKVKPVLQEQSDKGYIAIRFDNEKELLKAKTDLIDGNKIFEIFTDTENVTYLLSNANLHLYIFKE